MSAVSILKEGGKVLLLNSLLQGLTKVEIAQTINSALC